MLKISYVSLLIGIAVSVFIGWRLSLPRKLPELPTWRRWLLLLGLVGNAASLVLFLTAILQIAFVTRSPTTNIENYRWFFPLAIVPVVLGAFGRRVPRVLVILNGLALTFLWLDLAASSL